MKKDMLQLCMKYANSCKNCPRNKQCERELEKERRKEDEKSKGIKTYICKERDKDL